MDQPQADERWERLLLALQQANNLPKPPEDEERERTLEETVIDGLACEIFITKGRINYCEVNAFEKYANCRITPAEQDSFGWVIGRITYGGRKYYFG